MNMFGMLETSGSAMQAERMRAEVVAANMANAETTRTADGGGPYHRQHVVFAANQGNPGFLDSLAGAAGSPLSGNSGAFLNPANLNPSGGSAWLNGSSSLNGNFSGVDMPGVHIAAVISDPGPPLKRYDPGHPDAGPDGYVSYPDINPLTEMVDLMGATRAYGLNGSAVQAEKGMITSALEIAKG
jgi:flagellar basal-body rod protein FlgC